MAADARSSHAPDPGAVLAGRRVVLGVSGGIAAYKAALVARLLVTHGASVDAVLTRGAREFVGAATFEGLTGRPVRTEVWEDVADETHVGLGRAADLVIVYPATAHVMAKLAGGLADDLLTTTLLVTRAPVVLAPAMHTEMWEHPATQGNAATLLARGVHLEGPAIGPLMGGDAGPGRAAEPDEVVAAGVRLLSRSHDLTGRRAVVTAGGTREHLDPVRYLGNRSSGKMGFALAREAAARGAHVDLVTAPTHLATPPGVSRHDVTSAQDMADVVHKLATDADVVVKAAAVADFRPAGRSAHKLKKSDGIPPIELVRNEDILAALGAARRGEGRDRPLLVGFAAETRDVEVEGRAKLDRKGADLLVVNDVSMPDAGFEVDTNRVLILGHDDLRIEVPLSSKAQIAARVWDRVVVLLSEA
ncbi:MAG TPA: bifunctional phosphopantothenoylcysteine decarboxylase/phosphopantothenate--cysteine ligase CoaBC [Nitriliruptorales bacterium]